MVSVRKMAEQDIQRVSKIMCNCYQWFGEHEQYTEEQIDFLVSKRGSVKTIKVESQNQLYLVACMGNDVVGIVAVKDDEITKLYVDPKHHRQGIGAVLFKAAERVIIEAGYEELVVGVMATSAVGFYRVMGFVEVGHKVSETGGCSGREVVLMKKTLDTKDTGN